jgi:hypothetical protein
LTPFALNLWLDTFEHGIEFNLAAGTGPIWTADEPLDLSGEQRWYLDREPPQFQDRLFTVKLSSHIRPHTTITAAPSIESSLSAIKASLA